jgi:hypothetical protein
MFFLMSPSFNDRYVEIFDSSVTIGALIDTGKLEQGLLFVEYKGRLNYLLTARLTSDIK